MLFLDSKTISWQNITFKEKQNHEKILFLCMKNFHSKILSLSIKIFIAECYFQTQKNKR